MNVCFSCVTMHLESVISVVVGKDTRYCLGGFLLFAINFINKQRKVEHWTSSSVSKLRISGYSVSEIIGKVWTTSPSLFCLTRKNLVLACQPVRRKINKLTFGRKMWELNLINVVVDRFAHHVAIIIISRNHFM